MTKPRLCFVIPSLGIGGTERQLRYMIHGLKDLFDISVICTRSKGAWFDEIRHTVRVEVLNLRGGWDPRLKSRLKRIFLLLQPDIVHSFMFGFDYPVNIAARAVGIPVVISSRRQLATWKKPRHIRLQKKANQLVDIIVANSQAVADFAAHQEDQPLSNYRVILNGIDLEQFHTSTPQVSIREHYGIPVDKKVIGIIANFSPVKNHLLFIEIATKLLTYRNDLHFIMVGSGPTLSDFTDILQCDPLPSCFTTLMNNPDLPDIYSILDAQVLCSHSEGFPNVIMEGMAAGVPIVASNVGGVPELIEHGSTGWLVDSPDSKTYADHIEWCLDASEEVTAMTQRARETIAQRASLDSMLKQYTMLYSTALSEKNQG